MIGWIVAGVLTIVALGLGAALLDARLQIPKSGIREVPRLLTDDGKRAVHEVHGRYSDGTVDWKALCLECDWSMMCGSRHYAVSFANSHKCEPMDGWR